MPDHGRCALLLHDDAVARLLGNGALAAILDALAAATLNLVDRARTTELTPITRAFSRWRRSGLGRRRRSTGAIGSRWTAGGRGRWLCLLCGWLCRLGLRGRRACGLGRCRLRLGALWWRLTAEAILIAGAVATVVALIAASLVRNLRAATGGGLLPRWGRRRGAFLAFGGIRCRLLAPLLAFFLALYGALLLALLTAMLALLAGRPGRRFLRLGLASRPFAWRAAVAAFVSLRTLTALGRRTGRWGRRRRWLGGGGRFRLRRRLIGRLCNHKRLLGQDFFYRVSGYAGGYGGERAGRERDNEEVAPHNAMP